MHCKPEAFGYFSIKCKLLQSIFKYLIFGNSIDWLKHLPKVKWVKEFVKVMGWLKEEPKVKWVKESVKIIFWLKHIPKAYSTLLNNKMS